MEEQKKKKRETFVIGDTHGDLSRFWGWKRKFKKKSFNIIHVGDIGVGFPCVGDLFLEELNEVFLQEDIKFYACRGNHDDPSFFDGSKKLSNLHLVEDGTVLTIEETNFFFYGGAISVDRQVRSEGFDYWSGEPAQKFEEKSILTNKKIDVVITHTCPRRVIPVVLPSNKGNGIVPMYANAKDKTGQLIDPHLIEDMDKELTLLDELEQVLTKNYDIKQWYYGHFHKSHSTAIDGIKYRCLNISEMYQYE